MTNDLRNAAQRALEALELIANTDPVDAALDPQRAVRVAESAAPPLRAALAAPAEQVAAPTLTVGMVLEASMMASSRTDDSVGTSNWAAAMLRALRDVAGRAAQAEPVAVPAEPLFLLHTGKIDSDGEQDEWETEADSGARVDEFCLAHPGQTIGLYPHATPAAPRQQPLTDEQIDELYIDGKRHWLGKRQIARAIERAHGIKGDSND